MSMPSTMSSVVENESGQPVAMTVDANTQFFFREPQNPAVDSNPIGTGPAFLASKNLVRGFKVHASVVDPLATPLVAQSIDIETASIRRRDLGAEHDGFHLYAAISVRRAMTTCIRSITSPWRAPTARTMSGNAIGGYKWWNFAYPTC